MRDKVFMLRQLVAESLYGVDERAVADAILARPAGPQFELPPSLRPPRLRTPVVVRTEPQKIPSTNA